MKNFFSFDKDRVIGISKSFCMSCSAIRKSCFIKFDQFFTNRLFMDKIRKNFRKNLKQRLGCQTPSHLILKFFRIASIKKMELTSKSLREPVKARRFRIIQLKSNFIYWIWSIFRKIFLNSQRAFCINKTSQICKIFFDRNNCVSNRFNFMFYGIDNKVRKLFRFHFFDKIVSCFMRKRITKVFKYFKFLFSLNQIRRQVELFSIFSGKIISKKRTMIDILVFNSIYRTSKFFNHPHNIIFVDGSNNQRGLVFCTPSYLVFSYYKATISVNISRKISKFGRVIIHKIKDMFYPAFKSIK